MATKKTTLDLFLFLAGRLDATFAMVMWQIVPNSHIVRLDN